MQVIITKKSSKKNGSKANSNSTTKQSSKPVSDLEKLLAEFPSMDAQTVKDIFTAMDGLFEDTRNKLIEFAEEQAKAVPRKENSTEDSASRTSERPGFENDLMDLLDEHIKSSFRKTSSEAAPSLEPFVPPEPGLESPPKLTKSHSSKPKFEEPVELDNLPCVIMKSKKKTKKRVFKFPNADEKKEKKIPAEPVKQNPPAVKEPPVNEVVDEEEIKNVRAQVISEIKHKINDLRENEEEQLNNEYINEEFEQDFLLVQKFILKKLEATMKEYSQYGGREQINEAFPTLSSLSFNTSKKQNTGKKANKQSEKEPERNLIKELKQEHEQKMKDDLSRPYQEYVHQQNTLPAHKSGMEWSHYSFNNFQISNDASDNLILLHSTFPRLSFLRLKMIFTELEEDFENTKDFLMSEFKQFYVPFISEGVPDIKSSSKCTKKYSSTYFNPEVIEYVNRTESHRLSTLINEVRQNLDNEFKLFGVYSKCVSGARSGGNSMYVSSYQCLRKNARATIEHWKEVSLYIVFRQSEECDFRKVDLHHLFLDEAIEVLQMVVEVIKARLDRMNCHQTSLEVITGKGNHSKNKAVLYPEIQKFLKSSNQKFTCGEGKLNVTVRI